MHQFDRISGTQYTLRMQALGDDFTVDFHRHAAAGVAELFYQLRKVGVVLDLVWLAVELNLDHRVKPLWFGSV